MIALKSSGSVPVNLISFPSNGCRKYTFQAWRAVRAKDGLYRKIVQLLLIVQSIAQKRMPESFHMDTDLMRAACIQAERYQ